MELIKQFLDKVFLTGFSEWSFVTFFVLIILAIILFRLAANDGAISRVCGAVGMIFGVISIFAFVATFLVELVMPFICIISGEISFLELIIRLGVIAIIVYLLIRYTYKCGESMSDLM
jgi:hypothetical protein